MQIICKKLHKFHKIAIREKNCGCHFVLYDKSLFTNGFVNHNLHVFVEPCFSTINSSYNTLDWILVSHDPDDVIVISPSTCPDSDPGNVFTQHQAEESLQLFTTSKLHIQSKKDH